MGFVTHFAHVETIGFDYGQRHHVELQARQSVLAAIRERFPAWAARLGEDHMVDLAVLGQISDTALTSETEIRMTEAGLPNGVRLLAVPMPQVQSVSVGVFLLPAALAARGGAIAKGWAGSLTMRTRSWACSSANKPRQLNSPLRRNLPPKLHPSLPLFLSLPLWQKRQPCPHLKRLWSKPRQACPVLGRVSRRAPVQVCLLRWHLAVNNWAWC